MNSKTTILVLICAAVTVTVLSLRQPTESKSIVPTAQNKTQLQRREAYPSQPVPVGNERETQAAEELTAADQEALKVIENSLRQIENEDVESRDRRARSGNAAMDSFLKRWNPIGRTPTDLRAVFGKPQRESDSSLLYSFDTGNYAWNYQFEVRDGKVVELTRPLSE